MKHCKKIIFIVVVTALSIYLCTEPLYTPTAIVTPALHCKFPRLIASINSTVLPNTTNTTFDMLSPQVDGIFLKVYFSKDQIPFICLQENLFLNNDSRFRTEDYTWKQLQELEKVSIMHAPLLLLEEVFQIVGSQKYILISLQIPIFFSRQAVQPIFDLIHTYQLQETVVIASFNPLLLTYCRLKGRDIILMYTVTNVAQQKIISPWLLRQPFIQKQVRRIIRPDIIGISYKKENQPLIAHLIKNNYPVISWQVEDSSVVKKLLAAGVKGIITDNFSDIRQINNFDREIYDAGGTKEIVYTIVPIHNVTDIQASLQKAREKKCAVTIAGRRHSMGGQTLYKNSIQLDMLPFNKVAYNAATKRVKVQAGATWRKVQHVLNAYGRAVQIMQSDNIFTVGGSVSVNVHGWEANQAPLVGTIHNLTLITADGKIRTIHKQQEPILFSAVVGGYGQFGVITEIELETVPNTMLQLHRKIISPVDFVEQYQHKVIHNPRAELAYGRFSINRSDLLQEMGLFWYERISNEEIKTPIVSEKLVAIKRGFLRTSQYTDIGKKIRWEAEKAFSYLQSCSAALSRNSIMSADIHILWPLYGKNKDILQEYFIPPAAFIDFVRVLQKLIIEYKINVMNVTVREIKKDNITMLPYATQNMFGFVILLSQTRKEVDEKNVLKFTQAVIEQVLLLKGTFYLPYRLHYTPQQLSKAYPHLSKWLYLKKQWDPDGIFNSVFYAYMKKVVA